MFCRWLGRFLLRFNAEFPSKNRAQGLPQRSEGIPRRGYSKRQLYLSFTIEREYRKIGGMGIERQKEVILSDFNHAHSLCFIGIWSGKACRE